MLPIASLSHQDVQRVLVGNKASRRECFGQVPFCAMVKALPWMGAVNLGGPFGFLFEAFKDHDES